ncbi:hypothetical protein EYF80_062974 [Liparis tanakae]|uniref:Uncharacterized protein n=1 Tax=Liparis tanakae TaxID=230148 RepID=A0A4Z2EDQ0_9TELE|nr:hypothetical protein EYF80_062974 [Liparis tanakae]
MHVPSFRHLMDSICCVMARTSWNPVLSPDMCWKYASFSTCTDRLFTPPSFRMAVTFVGGGNRNHTDQSEREMSRRCDDVMEPVGTDLLDDPLLHHVGHDLEVDGAADHASFSSGMTLRKMSVAMKSEQMGSAISHPNWRMRMVEMMTPTLPSVSASTWR